MREAISIREKRWLFQDDLARPIAGRDDPDDVVEECWHHLEAAAERAEHQRRGRFSTSSALIAARIHASAGSATSEDLPEVIRRQQAAIDRLLAFVPTRAKPLSASRIAGVQDQLEQASTELFGEHRILVDDEDDTDSIACHRFTVEAKMRDDFDPALFVAATTELFKRLAQRLSEEEYEALRVIVEPVQEIPGESDGQS